MGWQDFQNLKKKFVCHITRETIFGGGCWKTPKCLRFWKRGPNPVNVHRSLIRDSLKEFKILNFFMDIDLFCETSTVHIKRIMQVI